MLVREEMDTTKFTSDRPGDSWNYPAYHSNDPYILNSILV